MACPLSYSLSITGDCSNTNSGAFNLQINGSAPDYTIQWLSPVSLGTIALGVGVTEYSVNSLSASTYSFNIIDSCSPTNTVIPVNVYISSGTCVSVLSFENTLCGLNNGSLSAMTSNFYGQASFYLYETTDGYITSASTAYNNYQFNSVSAGTYYVVANDGGGCTGQSETIIIQDSNTVDFGLYVVNDAGCAVNSGKIFVTGLTGNPPYTYLWSNGSTGSTITGLTTGGYNVTVTDNTGCSVTKSTLVSLVPPLGIVSILTTDPSCNSSDGEIKVYITGGTAPYNFSGTSIGNYFTFGSEYTFTNVSSGNYGILVTDSGLCTSSGNVTLNTPGGFSVVSFTHSDSVCGASGVVSIILNGGSPPYVYTLTKVGGSTTTQTLSSPSWSFNNLTSGDYVLTITDNGPCDYSSSFTIADDNSFSLSTNITGTTCGNNNGILTVNVSGGSPLYTYTLDGGDEIIVTSLSSNTFNNLTSGYHTVDVLDSNGCKQSITSVITSSSGVDFLLSSTNSTIGNNGSISTFITSGEPPFTLTWSNNVNGQTGLTINNLSAGTYTLKIVDNNSCERIRTVIIDGTVEVSSYQVYSVCDSDLSNYGELLTKGPKQMLLEGFSELTLNEFNCVLNEAIFEASVTVSGVTTTQEFYTGTTLNEYPTVNEWNDVIESMLLSYDGISSVTFDVEENKMIITTDCNSIVSLNDADVTINMVIYYDISCESCTGCYTPEFEPINCEITNEYCETTDTKMIFPIQYNFFGADYLNDTNIIPNRCTELPNYYYDCNDPNDAETQFREIQNGYMKYQSSYNLLLYVGRVSLANSIPVELPPSAAELDFFYYGPDNIGWNKFNILQGCSCKKIFADDGYVGPQYDFDIVFLTEVQSYGDLPLTGVFGQQCFVLDDDMFYQWNPNTNTWVSSDDAIVGYPHIEDCWAPQRVRRDAYLKALNELNLAWRPFTWATFHAPLYQIFKYKF
jgi:hypothetical protein